MERMREKQQQELEQMMQYELFVARKQQENEERVS